MVTQQEFPVGPGRRARQWGSAPEYRPTGKAALGGPGWMVPDQALRQYPLPDWDRRIRLAVDALADGLGDRVAYRFFADDDREEATAAFALHTYTLRLRRDGSRQ